MRLFFLSRSRMECHMSQNICFDVVHYKILHGIRARLMQNNSHCCFQLLPLVIWFFLLAFLKHVVKVRNFKECCLHVHEEMVEDSKNYPVQISSFVASFVLHEDNIWVTAINTFEEKIFHVSSLFFNVSSIESTSVRKKDPLDVLEKRIKSWSCSIHSPWIHASYVFLNDRYHRFSELHRRWRTPIFTWSWSHILWFEAKVSSVSSCIWFFSHPSWFNMQVQMASIFSYFHCWRNQAHVLGAWSTYSQEEYSSRHSHLV